MTEEHDSGVTPSHAPLAEGFDGSGVRPGPNHSTIELWYGTEDQARAAHQTISDLIDAALGAGEVHPVAWPEPVAHVHSNGEFCADRQITAGAMPGNLWPISLYTEEQVRELLAAHGVQAGDVVVTKNPAGQIVAVTRQDDEGRILEVIAQSTDGVKEDQRG